ncbi:MAG: aminotransferase class I/II-fold pyridoxal phosphate-dependent enzyme, partial [Pseudomonadota bacterium]
MIPQPHIAELSAYALADMAVAPGKRLISLAQNESAAAPSPRALAAAREALGRSVLYPDPDWGELRAAIAETHGLDPAMILCGAGSMELIGALIRAYAGPGAEVLASSHTYAFFRTAAAQARAPYRWVEEADLTVSVDALLGAVGPETRVVAVANPGNPTGTWLPPAEIRRLRDGLPESVLLIVDEAYGEFAGSPAHFDLP